MEKKKKSIRFILGGVTAALGIAIAVMVADNSRYELLARLAGVALFVAGAWIGDLFDNYTTTEE